MATVADTLNDIQRFQNEVSSKKMEYETWAGSTLPRDLMNFTTIYFFDLLAHATLDALRSQPEAIRHPYADKYYSMYREQGLLQELVRKDNVSGMFVLWNMFERHVDQMRANFAGNPERTLEERYKSILREYGIEKRVYDRIISEFNLIRLTRNSLHAGGIFRNRRAYSFTLKGRTYSLRPGEAVTPLRLMDVIETMWKHFVVVFDMRKHDT